MIVGVDWGNLFTKIAMWNKVEIFPSDMIPYRYIDRKLGDKDFIFQYGARKGLAGTLAQDEKSALHTNRRGDTKNHKDALIRLLIALHKYGEGIDFKVVVGQPPKDPQEDKKGLLLKKEKESIVQMLKKEHEFTLNDETKIINIRDVIVAPEAGVCGVSHPKPGIQRYYDLGSGTIILATVKNGQYSFSESKSIARGLENISDDPEAVVEMLKNHEIDLGWKGGTRQLVGGGAYDYSPVFEYPVLETEFNGDIYGPEFATVIALYELGVGIWGKN